MFFGDEEFARLPPERRRALSRVAFRGLAARVDSAMVGDTFDARTDRHISWVSLGVDERGWSELMRAMIRWLEEAEGIKAEAGARLRESGEEAIPATLGMVGFESPPRP
jgi:hypothetical protein